MVDSEHDVFIAHHAANADAAQSLAQSLNALGLTTRHSGEHSHEDPARHAGTGTMLRSKLLVVWLSNDYIGDPALQRALMYAIAAASRHPRGERIVLIDARQSGDVALPKSLQVACDVIGVGQLRGLAERLSEKAGAIVGALSRIDSGNLEMTRSDACPRTGLLWQLYEALHLSPHVQLVGVSGCGKSWLADDYARVFAADYPGGIYRLDAGWFEHASPTQRQSLREHAWREIGFRLGATLDDADSFEIVSEVRKRLDPLDAPYLWIVDHLPSGLSTDEARAWLAPTPRGATVLIAREALDAAIAMPIEVGGLDSDEARTLLHRIKPMATPQEASAGRDLLEQLGGHALALRLAAARLARSTYDRMLLQLAAPAREAAIIADGLAESLPHPQLVGIAVSIQRSVARLSSPARQALRLVGVLAPAPLPIALLTTALAQQARGTVKTTSHGSVSNTQLAIDELVGYGLAQLAHDDTLVVTRTVRDATLYHEAKDALDTARALLLAVLAGELPSAARPDRSNPYWRWIPHVLHLARTTPPGAQVLEINAWLARFDSQIGALRSDNRRAVTLLQQGDVEGAEAVLDMEVAARSMGLGEHHPGTVAAVNNLGAALTLRGDFARARQLFERAINIRRKTLGDSHLDLLTPLNNLGVAFWHEGEHVKARKIFEKVVELRKAILGDTHPDTLVSMRNLAAALRHDGDFVAARTLLEHVIEVRGRSLGRKHVDTCTAMASLAETLREHSNAILNRLWGDSATDAERASEVHDDQPSIESLPVFWHTTPQLASERK